MIGLDYYFACVNATQIKGHSNEPVALNSIFGWIIRGCYSNLCHLLRVSTEDCFTHSGINHMLISFETTALDDIINWKNERVFITPQKNIAYYDN